MTPAPRRRSFVVTHRRTIRETDLKAAQIMTRNVRTVTPDTPARAVARLLMDNAISAVPVVDPSGIPLGVVSEADFVRRPELATTKRRSWWLAYVADPQGGAEDFIRSHGQSAAEIMHRGVVAVGPDAELAKIADLLERRKVKRVFVIDGNAIAGVITRSDFVRAVARTQAPATAGGRSDAQIREDIERRMADEPWAPRALVTVMVENGNVSLLGMVTSEAERSALCLLAREVDGVAEVADHLVVRAIPIVAGGMM
jgi:CBS domain-containing protein